MINKNVLMLSDITGLGPDYHVGDEAMAEVAIERLSALVGRENLVLGCSSPEQVPATYNIKAFAFYHTTDKQFSSLAFRKPLSYLKATLVQLNQILRCRAIIVCGGGNMTSVWPRVLESRLRLLKLAAFFGRKIFLVSQTLGPYDDRHRKRVNEILSKAEWVGVRDRHFSHTQVDFPVKFAVDDACFLSMKHNAESREISANASRFACVAMRKFGAMNDRDVTAVASAIRKVTHSLELETVFIPHHAPRGTEGDIRLAQEIKALWEGDKFTIVDPILLASSLKALTADSELVISMRYHQIIFALSIGMPCVAIYVDEYTQAKLTGAFEAVGVEPLVTSFQDVDANLAPLVDKALAGRAVFKEAAEKLAKNETAASMRPYNRIAQLYNPAIELDEPSSTVD